MERMSHPSSRPRVALPAAWIAKVHCSANLAMDSSDSPVSHRVYFRLFGNNMYAQTLLRFQHVIKQSRRLAVRPE
jgi:hypothetical protein